MRLIGIGVGPGDPELVTVKAARLLASADRVFVPVLDQAQAGRAEATVACYADPTRVERLTFTLGKVERLRYWQLAGARVAAWLAQYGGVAAFATIGDPNIYSTFGYLAQAVRAALPGVEVETVPGVTAMQALAAASGTILVEGVEPLVLVPQPDGADATLAKALALEATVVVYKAGRHVAEVAAAIERTGRRAIAGAQLGLPEQWIGEPSDVDGALPYLSTLLSPAPGRRLAGARPAPPESRSVA